MTRRTGDMFDHFDEADLFLVTTNSYVRKDGSLVMGAGAAKQLRDRVRGIAHNFGQKIREGCGHLGEYGIITAGKPMGKYMPETETGAFQVKTDWQNQADTRLLAGAAKQLTNMLGRRSPDWTVFVNYPGIGNGGLSKTDVAPIINGWPDNVHVWTFE